MKSPDLELERRIAIQAREALAEHKWYRSEAVGHDIGCEAAMMDWVASGQAARFAHNYDSHHDTVESVCDRTCGPDRCQSIVVSYGSPELKVCQLQMPRIHEMLED